MHIAYYLHGETLDRFRSRPAFERQQMIDALNDWIDEVNEANEAKTPSRDD